MNYSNIINSDTECIGLFTENINDSSDNLHMCIDKAIGNINVSISGTFYDIDFPTRNTPIYDGLPRNHPLAEYNNILFRYIRSTYSSAKEIQLIKNNTVLYKLRYLPDFKFGNYYYIEIEKCTPNENISKLTIIG